MSKGIKDSQFSFSSIFYRIVGILLILTLLTTCMISRLHAKYVVSDSISDSARVAKAGSVSLELWEHKAKETDTNSGIYELESATVKNNEYKKVLPGVDIPKDPYINVKISDSEMNYELYVRVDKSAGFPQNVTYTLTDKWETVDKDNGIYKYKQVFEAGKRYELSDIPILKDNKIIVGEYFASDKGFSLTFSAYVMQAQTN